MSKVRVGDIRIHNNGDAVYLILPDKRYFALKESEANIGKVFDGSSFDDALWDQFPCIGNLIEDDINWENLYEAYIASR